MLGTISTSLLIASFVAVHASLGQQWQGTLEAATPSERQALLESGLQERRTAMANVRLVVEESEFSANNQERKQYIQATYELRHLEGSYYIRIHHQSLDKENNTLKPLFDSESNYLKEEGVARMYAHQLIAGVQGGRVSAKEDGVIREFIYGLHVNDFGVDKVEPFLPTAARLMKPELALPAKWKTEQIEIGASELSLASESGEQKFEAIVLRATILFEQKSGAPSKASYSLTFVPDLTWLPAIVTKRFDNGNGKEWSEQEYKTTSFRKVDGVALPLLMTTRRTGSASPNSAGVIESKLLEATIGKVTPADLTVSFPAGVEVIDEISGKTGIADATGGYDPKTQQAAVANARRDSNLWSLIAFNIAAVVFIGSIWLYMRRRNRAPRP